MAQKLLKVRDVAERLWVSRATVYRLVDEGRLEPHWVGTSIRIPSTSVDAFLSKRTSPTSDKQA